MRPMGHTDWANKKKHLLDRFGPAAGHSLCSHQYQRPAVESCTAGLLGLGTSNQCPPCSGAAHALASLCRHTK